MPNYIDLFPQNYSVASDPTNTLDSTPSDFVGQDPFTTGGPIVDLALAVGQLCNIFGYQQQPFFDSLTTDGSGDNAGAQMMSGGQALIDLMCSLFMGTSFGGRRLRLPGSGTTTTDIANMAQGIHDAITGNSLAMGILGMGGSSGNRGVDALNGGMSFASQITSHAIGLDNIGTHPTSTVLSNTKGAIGLNTTRHVRAQSSTPATAISLSTPNLLVAENFNNPGTVVTDSSQTWEYDATTGYNDIPGSVKVTCNGTLQELVSNEVHVSAGENVQVTCQLQWIGLVYTGAGPIQLGVQKYRRLIDATTRQFTYVDMGKEIVASATNPGTSDPPASSSTGSMLPVQLPFQLGDSTTGGMLPVELPFQLGSGNSWTATTGTYTVKPGEDQLRFLFRIDPLATAGEVWWDAAEFLQLNLIPDAAVPGVGLTTDNVVTQLYGDEGSGFSHTDEAVALASTATSLISANAQIAVLLAQIISGGTGGVAADDFDWTGEIVANTNWDGFYQYSPPGTGIGEYSASAGIAKWYGTAAKGQQAWYRWVGSDATSSTQYQLIQLVLSTAGTSRGVKHSYIYVYGRVSADWSNYIEAGFCSDGTYTVAYHTTAAGRVVMQSGSCAVPGPGAILSLYCGNKGTSTLRHFTLQVGSSTIADFDEVGTGSSVTDQGWGWGGAAQGGYDPYTHQPYQTKPSSVNQWLGCDQ
jgi:hypothetical protein